MHTATKPHWSFWLIAIFALVWNGLGSVNFLVQMNPEMVAAAPESHQAIIIGRPVWATAGFGVGVFAATLAGVFLMLKKPMAMPLFWVSLIGIAITMIHTLNVASATAALGFGSTFVMAWLPMIVGVFLLWYTRRAINLGWLK